MDFGNDDTSKSITSVFIHFIFYVENISACPLICKLPLPNAGLPAWDLLQRVLLARALYRQPRVLVLDEATSHLDVLRERQVNEAIRALPITRITIAHRPETIAMADRVIDLSALTRTAVADIALQNCAGA